MLKKAFSTERLNVFKVTVLPSDVNTPRDVYFAFPRDGDMPYVAVVATVWTNFPHSRGRPYLDDLATSDLFDPREGLAREVRLGIEEHLGARLLGVDDEGGKLCDTTEEEWQNRGGATAPTPTPKYGRPAAELGG